MGKGTTPLVEDPGVTARGVLRRVGAAEMDPVARLGTRWAEALAPRLVGDLPRPVVAGVAVVTETAISSA